MKRTSDRRLLCAWIMVGALLLVACLFGCATPRARAGIVNGVPVVDQSGPIAEPARAAVETASAVVPIPTGSIVILPPDADPSRPVEIRLSGPTELRTETRREAVEGAKSFTPPVPPTPADEADGRALWFYRIGLGIGLAAALFGLVRDWDFVMYGGGAVAAACACGIFVQKHPALFGLIGAGIALAIAGVWVWHSRLKKQPA